MITCDTGRGADVGEVDVILGEADVGEGKVCIT